MRWPILIVAAFGISALPAVAQETTSPKSEAQGQMQASEWKGLSVYGSDDQEIGEVASVQMGPDGTAQSLMVRTGQDLGLGERIVEIESGDFQKSGNRITLQMTSDEVKEMPGASGSGAAGQSK